MKSYKYTLEGLDCAACAKKVEDEIANTEGYEDVVVKFSSLGADIKRVHVEESTAVQSAG